MNKDTIANITKNVKLLNFKGNGWQMLNTVILIFLIWVIYAETKPLNESQYQNLYNQIEVLQKQNVELQNKLNKDSTMQVLKQLEESFIEKTNEIEDELVQIKNQKDSIYTNINAYTDKQLLDFFTKYDQSNFFQPYVIQIE